MRAAPVETLIELSDLRRSAKGQCPMCRGIMRPWRAAGLNPSVDHINPRAWGGNNSTENLRLMCRQCNSLRGSVSHCLGALACVLAVAPPSKVGRTWANWRMQRYWYSPETVRATTPASIARKKAKRPELPAPQKTFDEPFTPPDPAIFWPVSPLDTYGGKRARQLTARLIKIGNVIAMRDGVKSV